MEIAKPTKILFLDIDGVLNSRRTNVAFNGLPHSFDASDMERFDLVAIALIRRLCVETKCSIVLSSDWRHDSKAEVVALALDLPVVDITPHLKGRRRGFEINAWLSAPYRLVKHYAIVDDIAQMLDSQKNHFVQTDDEYGLTLRNYLDLKKILNGGVVDATDDPEVQETVSPCVNTYAGFRGGHLAINKAPPTGQEIWNAGVRSGLSRARSAPLAGQGVSVDVSTGDEDAGNRIFATLTGDCGSDGTLCAEETSRNFLIEDKGITESDRVDWLVENVHMRVRQSNSEANPHWFVTNSGEGVAFVTEGHLTKRAAIDAAMALTRKPKGDL